MSDTEQEAERLRRECDELRHEIRKLESMKTEYGQTLEKLRSKEEFNFALFQYNPSTLVVVDLAGRVIKSNKAKLEAGDRLPEIGGIMYRDYASRHSIDMYAELISCIRTGETRTYPRMPYDSKTLAVTIAPFPQGAIIATQDITARVQAENDRNRLIVQLQKALEEVETLRGLLPICSACKKIRDDQGYWSTVEEYFSKRAHLDFSHTVCPACFKKLYPDLWDIAENKRHAECEHDRKAIENFWKTQPSSVPSPDATDTGTEENHD